MAARPYAIFVTTPWGINFTVFLRNFKVLIGNLTANK
jgi:hypothetical protein